MLDSSRDDEKIASPELDLTITQLHPESTAMHEEHLVFVVVMMPYELADELHDLDVLTVQLADDLRRPVIRESGELRCERDFFHCRVVRCAIRSRRCTPENR